MEWIEMGGYATYVWPVFIVALLLVIGIAITPSYRHKRVIRELKNERELAEED